MRILFLVAALALLGGCGTCQTPMQRAADHGVVLECHPGKKPGTTTCTVSTKHGDVDYTYRRTCE